MFENKNVTELSNILDSLEAKAAAENTTGTDHAVNRSQELCNLATMVNKGDGDETHESIQCKVLELFSENPRLSLISGIGLN